jgi:predicted DNA-binding transcriptional regulator YafY
MNLPPTPSSRGAGRRSNSLAVSSSVKGAAAKGATSASIDLGLPKCGQTVWARVARLHGLLCQERTFTAVSLAQELETNKRTIKRTVAFMRYSLGAPVEYDKQRATYRYTEHWPFLPLVRVRPDEEYVLKLLQRLLPGEVGSPLGDALRGVLKKISLVVGGARAMDAGAVESVVFPAALLGAAEQRHLPALQQAIEQCRELEIRYRKAGDTEAVPHTIRPHCLRFIKRHWVLLTHDVTRGGAQRTFVLKRVLAVKFTRATFERPKDFDAAKILAGNFGAYTGNEDHRVRIRLRGAAAVDALENAWHDSQQHIAQLDGSVEITLRLNNLVEIKYEILRWGELAEALEPAALRAAVQESLAAAAAIYLRPAA